MDDRNHDTWSDLQAFKSRQNSLREKFERRKKEREDILANSTTTGTDKVRQPTTTQTSVDSSNELYRSRATNSCNNSNKSSVVNSICTAITKNVANDQHDRDNHFRSEQLSSSSLIGHFSTATTSCHKFISDLKPTETIKDAVGLSTTNNENFSRESFQTAKSINDHRLPMNSILIDEIERKLLQCLCDSALKLPIDSQLLLTAIRKSIHLEKSAHLVVVNLLEKFVHQGWIQIVQDSLTTDGEMCVVVSSADQSKLIQFGQQSNANDRQKDCQEENISTKSTQRLVNCV